MKREFKFRAWIISQKKMIKVFGFNEHLVFEQNWDSPSIKENIFEIEDCVLMQFTGFKDKNGVDIYEGDIIEKHFEKFEIIWDEGSWQLTKLNDWYKQQFYIAHLFDYEKAVVVGNIYENPELLSTPTAVL